MGVEEVRIGSHARLSGGQGRSVKPEPEVRRAARLLLARWKERVAERRSFAFESTLSGLTYAPLIQEAKARGYRLNLCYLHLATLHHSIRRVREQVKKGGHDVPRADLKRRFLPSLRNFFHLYLPLAEHAVLYDSTLQPPCLVAEWHQSKPDISTPVTYERILHLIGQELSS